MNELIVTNFKKSLGKVVTAVHNIRDNNGELFTEYIQGVLIEVTDELVTIEQYFSMYNLFNNIESQSDLRVLRIGEFRFIGNLQG